VPTVDEIADELYALPPARFTPARDAHVQQARQDGDAAAAKAIAALRRPTVNAWLVNLLALMRTDLISDLFELGRALREAQRQLNGAALRDLSARRRELLDGLLAQVRRLAAEQGMANPTPAALTEVKDTLAAALADDGVAEQVRRGRMLKTVSYAGFGESPVADTATPAPSSTSDRTAVKTATAEVDRAERALTDAQAAEAAATDRVDEINASIADLRTRLPVAQDEAREATRARKAAEREVAAARHRLARASGS
jgi:hypothetical protein